MTNLLGEYFFYFCKIFRIFGTNLLISGHSRTSLLRISVISGKWEAWVTPTYINWWNSFLIQAICPSNHQPNPMVPQMPFCSRLWKFQNRHKIPVHPDHPSVSQFILEANRHQNLSGRKFLHVKIFCRFCRVSRFDKKLSFIVVHRCLS